MIVLKSIVSIPGKELVKFLQDILDCLFEILDADSNKYGELVFDVLVSHDSYV